MRQNSIQIIFGIIVLTLFFSCEKEQIDKKSGNSIRIHKWIIITDGASDTLIFDYDENGLLVRGNHCGGIYYTNEYDDSSRLIRTDSYNSQGLYHYFTFQYDSNSITRIRYQYYPLQNTWGGDNEKSVFCYNSQNFCERIDYYTKNANGNWIKSDYKTVYTWTNSNLTELINYNGNNLESTETYQYDDKLNPEKLLGNIIEPWSYSKNNIIRSLKKYSDGREITSTYKYSYNEYGYPTIKIRIDEIGSTEKYEYEFK